MRTSARTALAALLAVASACTPRLYLDPPGDAGDGAVDGAPTADAPAAGDRPGVDVPPIDAPGDAGPAIDTSSADAAVAEVAVVDIPVVDIPVVDIPVVDSPAVDVVAPGECTPGATRSCYDGAGTVGVGRCRAGTQTCAASGTWPSACAGAVGAVTEVCGNAVDDDCDGHVDEGCRVLGAFASCPTAMFGSLDLDEDFDNPGAYAGRWMGSWVAPQVSGGALTFGPHPLTPNWWENYSPTRSNRTFRDALLCATFTFTPAATGDNTGNLEVSLRGVSEGMVVSVRGFNNDVVLQTKRADGSWALHATAPLAFTRDAVQTVDVMLLAAGDRFRAEVRNVATGATVALRAQYTLPEGPVGLLGWMLRNAARVDRVRVGPPSAEVTRVLDNPDY